MAFCGPLVCGACLFYESYECSRRCCWPGSMDSSDWPAADPEEVYEITRHCSRVLGAYGKDGGEVAALIKPHDSSFRRDYVVALEKPSAGEEGGAFPPPFFLCVDEAKQEVAVYLRGLQLGNRQDLRTLMTNRHGEQVCEDGLVHFGMHGAAQWALTHIAPKIKAELETHPGYRVVIVGHSLGAGVASIFTLLLLLHPEALGGIERERLHCFAIAPPRVMSAALATKYSDVISSVIYQDDFLPRTSASSAERVLAAAIACTGAILCYHCVTQFCYETARDGDQGGDATGLCPPGKVYHVVYKKPGSCKQQPIMVRAHLPTRDRFERLVVSTSATSNDHSVLQLTKHLLTYAPPHPEAPQQPPAQQEMK